MTGERESDCRGRAAAGGGRRRRAAAGGGGQRQPGADSGSPGPTAAAEGGGRRRLGRLHGHPPEGGRRLDGGRRAAARVGAHRPSVVADRWGPGGAARQPPPLPHARGAGSVRDLRERLRAAVRKVTLAPGAGGGPHGGLASVVCGCRVDGMKGGCQLCGAHLMVGWAIVGGKVAAAAAAKSDD